MCSPGLSCLTVEMLGRGAGICNSDRGIDAGAVMCKQETYSDQGAATDNSGFEEECRLLLCYAVWLLYNRRLVVVLYPRSRHSS
jgi:hypothetical protein